MSRRLHGFLTLAFFAASCQSDPTPREKDPAGREEIDEPQPLPALTASRHLVAAAPAAWPEPWKKLRATGATASPALVRALRENPEGPGAQAAVHLLGRLGGDGVRTYLESTLDDGSNLASEAALALGRLGDQASVGPLRAALGSRSNPITTRAAAVAALVDLGHARSVLPFLRAVFLAASPNAAPSTREQGLPIDKVRWALERYMIIQALRRRYDGRTFGLDEDSSWPRLREATAAMSKFIAG